MDSSSLRFRTSKRPAKKSNSKIADVFRRIRPRSEANFQHTLIKKLRKIPDTLWFVKEAGSIHGISDILGIVKGRFIALEVKKSKSEAEKSTGRTVLQKRFLSEVTKSKGFATFIYPENEEEVLDYLRRL